MNKPPTLLKKLPSELQKHIKNNRHKYASFDLYVQDESRFGLKSYTGRMITAKGVAPVCPFQHRFDNMYLFGAFPPLTGDSLLLELPYCNTDMFALFLEHLSQQKPDELKIIILDNGAFHKAARLGKPDSIEFIFLPPYTAPDSTPQK